MILGLVYSAASNPIGRGQRHMPDLLVRRAHKKGIRSRFLVLWESPHAPV
jgi:hypothetical protein